MESKTSRKQLSVELKVRKECGYTSAVDLCASYAVSSTDVARGCREMPHIVRLFDVFYANGRHPSTFNMWHPALSKVLPLRLGLCNLR